MKNQFRYIKTISLSFHRSFFDNDRETINYLDLNFLNVIIYIMMEKFWDYEGGQI